jgi:hypothetical protein
MSFLHFFNICKNQLFDFQALMIDKSPVLLRSERHAVAFDTFFSPLQAFLLNTCGNRNWDLFEKCSFMHFFNICKNQPIDFQAFTIK